MVTASKLAAFIQDARAQGIDLGAVRLNPADLDGLQACLVNGATTTAVYASSVAKTMPAGASMMFMGTPVFASRETPRGELDIATADAMDVWFWWSGGSPTVIVKRDDVKWTVRTVP
jgi:hypothetical protein